LRDCWPPGDFEFFTFFFFGVERERAGEFGGWVFLFFRGVDEAGELGGLFEKDFGGSRDLLGGSILEFNQQ